MGKVQKLRSDREDRLNLDWAGTRSFMRGMGYSDDDMEKPRIGIVNTWNEMNPGHIHQQPLAEAARGGITEAGGMPFLFYGISLCDCVGYGSNGDYILPSRDLLVNEIELIAQAHELDGMVLIGTCDKIVPAMLMAAGRLDIPTVIITGGYMKTNRLNGEYVDFIDIGSSITKVKEGRMTRREFEELINTACPGRGACGMMGTANTMSILTETIGMSLTHNATTAAISGDMLIISRNAGRQVMDLWRKGITPRKIITEKSITNAIRVCMAIGGSSNTVIHIPAVATEAELEMDCSFVYAQASQEIPLLVGIRPNGEHCMADFDVAGGVPALLNELHSCIDLTGITVSGHLLGENIIGYVNKDPSVIHPISKPISHDGGLLLCRGNLVPEGAFIKAAAVPEQLRDFRGQARVFNDPESAVEALYSGRIKEGDAVLVIYQGVKAGPNSAYAFTTALKGTDMINSVITITDGRLSGAASGACFGYASPEAALKGPLCAVQDGDWINYNLDERTLNVELSDEEIIGRIAKVKLAVRPRNGYLGIYQRCVGSVLKGAVLRGDQ